MRPQLGSGLLERYGGRASNLVAAAGGSAVALVALLLDCFPGFRDCAVYECAPAPPPRPPPPPPPPGAEFWRTTIV